MLEHYFETPFVLKQLRSGASSLYIDGFAKKLKEDGYSSWTARRVIRPAVHLGHFVQLKGWSMERLDEGILTDFLDHNPCRCSYSRGGAGEHRTRGARLFVAYLQDSGVIQQNNANQIPLITSFRDWLGQTVGLAPSTQYRYGRRVLVLLESLGDNPSQYNAQNLRRFILEYSRGCGRAGTANICTAVKTFLRFLAAQEQCQTGLEHAIPPLPSWRGTSPHKYLTPVQVERVIDTCDLNTMIGIRNRAILLLLSRLGLRAGDVVALRRSDMDWENGSFLVSGKGRRQERLPLPQEVGEAVWDYLQRRPDVSTDYIFISARAPYGPLSSSIVSYIAAQAMRQAGVQTNCYGAHILRHTAATHMLHQGVPLPKIGAVLRHRSQDMTAHYAKVDIQLLNGVVQPWPEVAPC
jgi:site-specific recombinase XerD